MRHFWFLAVLALLISFPGVSFASVASDVSGRIVLDVENNGEAWYVNPVDLRRYYLGRPEDAFAIMRSLGLGISNSNLAQFSTDADMKQRLAGRILLQVEDKGQAFYVHPTTQFAHYLGTAEDAFALMSSLGLGISSSNLASIPVAGSGSNTPVLNHSNTVYLSGIPFVAQAPFGDWADLRQQEACEETSALLAMHWVWGDTILTKQETLDEILEMTNWEERTYGYHHDTSAADTVNRIFKTWFNFHNLDLRYDINTQDIIDELEAGNLVLVPIHGSLIGNPHYSGPVERHMIVMNGYDYATGEFIMHDPGTRWGEDIRFTRANVERSLRDYASGAYEPIGPGRTAMIVVYK